MKIITIPDYHRRVDVLSERVSRQMLTLHHRGLSLANIAEKFLCDSKTVHRRLVSLGEDLSFSRGGRPEGAILKATEEKLRLARKMRSQGKTLGAIGKRLRMTTQGVSQLLSRHKDRRLPRKS